MNFITVTPGQLRMIFDEWAREFAADPESFGPTLNEDGSPCLDYGECCARQFLKIHASFAGKTGP